jgi:glycosyltransferase involved in cell wall biosynthesis
MRIADCFDTDLDHGSVRWFYRTLREELAAAHDVVFRPRDWGLVSDADQRVMAETFVRDCDLIVGTRNVDVLMARQRIGSRVPYMACLLGNVPRGAAYVRDMLPYLTSADTLLVNCTADVEMLRKFVPDARIRVLPFAVDHATFFPVDAATRLALRTKHGFGERDQILLYAGRGTVSKNLLALLRAFAAVARVLPDAHLVIAGPVFSDHRRGGGIFGELGVWPVNLARTLQRYATTLGVPTDRYHLVGNCDGVRLRELYCLADVNVNMTLHHDENFGLSQVEAMACGTPVVGSAWGGLKDTVVDGTSGYQVTVAINSTGVKANWWEAANKIVRALTSPDASRLRDSCVEHVSRSYSRAVFRCNLETLLAECVGSPNGSTRALEVTEFATEYWSTCFGPKVMYRAGHRSFELYADLMAAYCGSTPEDVGAAEPLEDDQLLCLPWAIQWMAPDRFRPNDPHHLCDVGVPPRFVEAFGEIMRVMRTRPVVSVRDLRQNVMPTGAFTETLEWMCSIVLFRSRSLSELQPQDAPVPFDEPQFGLVEVDTADVDFIVYR